MTEAVYVPEFCQHRTGTLRCVARNGHDQSGMPHDMQSVNSASGRAIDRREEAVRRMVGDFHRGEVVKDSGAPVEPREITPAKILDEIDKAVEDTPQPQHGPAQPPLPDPVVEPDPETLKPKEIQDPPGS